MDYFDAYKIRMEQNDKYFRSMAEQFKQLGCEVLANKHGLIIFLLIIKDGKHCYFGFTDIPYHFYLSVSIEPSKEHGSGYVVKEQNGTTCDWDVDFIMSNMKDKPKRWYISHLQTI